MYYRFISIYNIYIYQTKHCDWFPLENETSYVNGAYLSAFLLGSKQIANCEKYLWSARVNLIRYSFESENDITIKQDQLPMKLQKRKRNADVCLKKPKLDLQYLFINHSKFIK